MGQEVPKSEQEIEFLSTESNESSPSARSKTVSFNLHRRAFFKVNEGDLGKRRCK